MPLVVVPVTPTASPTASAPTELGWMTVTTVDAVVFTVTAVPPVS
ncbi:MAG: hypothetical protein QOE57_3518, partial [Acidimicrobiaceae bacterium]|nr:hypothetical protein [Acidimicrobiaceae bacterium]